jgi:intracellular sulfur oxidation DsrE/DsrF family protein
MCKKNMKTDICYANIWKHEYEKNITRLWCKIVPKTGVQQIEGNEGSYSYLYPFGDLP